MTEPNHQKQYREAWQAWKKTGNLNRKKELEKKMDNAQNNFEWDEFQLFKKTLPGFCEHWDKWNKELKKAVCRLMPN